MKKLYMFVLVIFVLVLGACGKVEMGNGFNDMKESFDENIEEEFLLYYYATSCVYCVQFKPVLNEYLEQENSLPIYALDLDDDKIFDYAKYFIEEKGWGLEGTPTLYHIKDGVSVGSTVGVQELSNIPTK